MQKIVPNLWFDTEGEEAAKLYTSLFSDSRITQVTHYPNAGQEITGKEPGSVMTVAFELAGQSFIALNGGPHFTLNPSISFTVACKTKEEVDRLWSTLSEGGNILMPLDAYPFSERYGWCSDRYGLSWQLVLDDGHYPYKNRIATSFLFVGKVAGKAEEAITLYASIFPESKLGDIARWPAGMEPEIAGTVMHGAVTLAGQEFFAMDSANEGHTFSFNEAFSLLVNCRDQAEVDEYTARLTEGGGEQGPCGWVKDRFGVSWQIAPIILSEMLKDPDTAKQDRVMSAMLKMQKIDIAALEAAYRG
ncbi:MAG TPA: VOC family protein [Candidatus Paceibacterota bacterium]|nr:VOC family protein [Candidatus Paceibacterota bacterium]